MTKQPTERRRGSQKLREITFSLGGMPLPDDAAALLADTGVTPSPELAQAIAHAWTYAPYLRGLMRGREATLATIVRDGPDVVVAQALAAARDAEAGPVAVRLRNAKRDMALAVALADISGAWPLEKVTQSLSDFADVALDVSIATAIAERTPGAPNRGFVALALGKHGSRELNYSSDVDLILLYDPDTLPHRENEEVADAAQRIARRMVELMQARDAHGYVFRVDLRLRPSPEATPIALPIGAAEAYYHSEAEPWERAAFIRARAVAGDMDLGASFFASIRPFVWRRALDYTAIREVESISLRIRDHFDAGQEMGPGFDLKRGRGGIRECEFFAQIHQLIYGGREPALRAPATLDALAALAAAGRIEASEAETLAQAYRLLRTVEHRIQMVGDEQTHALPKPAAAARQLSQFCGLSDWKELEAGLGAITERVAHIYDRLIAGSRTESEELPTDHDGLVRHLKSRKFAKPADMARLIEGWRAGDCRALRTPEARRAFEAVLCNLLDAFAASVDARATSVRFDNFVRQLPAGVQFFALLEANPRLVPLLGRLLGLSPVLADSLARTPDLFDVMLDPEAFAPLPSAAALEAELRALTDGGDYQDILDRTRRWTAERRFQVGAQLIEEHTDPLRAAADYAALADAAMVVLVEACCAEFSRAHGHVPGAALLVLGLGRYGGGLLTAGSDLDLIYLFSGAHDQMSDGAKPLAATMYFNRLGQRLTAALSVPTAAGALYEVDTRLRPSGSQGLLAASIESFVRYQQEEAWTFEHMALTRARVVAGRPEDRAAVAQAIATLLHGPRDPVKLRNDVLAVRRDMAAAKPGGGLWDVKLGQGGLVDLEFVVHYLQLRDHVAITPRLHDACAGLAAAGLVDAVLQDAHDLMTRLLVIWRLVGVDGDPSKAPPQLQKLLAQSCGAVDFAALKDRLTAAKAGVSATWEATFGAPRPREK